LTALHVLNYSNYHCWCTKCCVWSFAPKHWKLWKVFCHQTENSDTCDHDDIHSSNCPSSKRFFYKLE